MKLRIALLVGTVWIVSLLAAGKVATAQARAFTRLPEPKVLAGGDVGFRVEGMYGEMPAGTIVVKVNGQWVEARLAPANPALAMTTR